MIQSKRHSGIDLMRIVCMLIIVLYHIQGHGGLAYNTQLSPVNRVLIISLQSVYQAAIDGFALISGYVGYKSRHRYSSLVTLWLRVMFYSVGITGIVWLLSPASVSRAEIRDSFLPLLTGKYWYFTAYAGCFVIAPLIRAAMTQLSRKEAFVSLCGLFFVFSFLPYLLRNDPFLTLSGNHALWLALLYALGAYVSKYAPFDRLSTPKLSMLFAAAAVIQMSAGFILQQISHLFTGKETTLWYFICHDSPTTLILSTLALALFSRIKLSIGNPVFRFLSLSSFSVYLIHDHPVIRRCMIIPLGSWLAQLPSALVIPAIFASGMSIYLICSLIDALREALFRFLRIQSRLSRIEDRILHIGQ